MQNNKVYENFPVWIPLLSCVLSISIYALGAFIFSQLAIIFTVLYLLFCLWVEFRIFQKSCANCYYYGKMCGLGRGKLCRLFFKKGNPEGFGEKDISWKDLSWDFLVVIFPVAGGIIILIRDFSWLISALIVILAVLFLGGNAIMRGSLACKYCKQRQLGCPAEQLFSKHKDGTKDAEGSDDCG
jgi:hypothetical protein